MVTSDGVQRSVAILRRLRFVDREFVVVFSIDNTNAIESFNDVKGRMTKETPTLVDVFLSITITEEIALARRNPASVQIPTRLIGCFLAVVSHDVLNVLSPYCVHGLLKCIVDSACNIVRNKEGDSECGVVVERAIRSGVVVTRFGWMPAEWVIPRDRQEATHCVVQIEVEQNTTPEDIVMGIEPF